MATSIFDSLTELGLTRYEAQAYGALLETSPLNGYEVAKASGVPRPNIYGVLDRLVERGAIMRVDEAGGLKFVPVASDEFLQRLRARFDTTLSDAEASLAQIRAKRRWEPVANSSGYEATVELARSLVRAGRKELLLAVWPEEAALLEREAQAAEARGVKVTSLCLAGCPHPCGHCAGEVYRYRVDPGKRARWLVLTADNRDMLSAEVEPNDTRAVRTSQRLLVELAAWYIRHTIALASLARDLSSEDGKAPSAETLQVLRSIGSAGAGHEWLSQIHEVIGEVDARASSTSKKQRKAGK